MEVKAPSSSIDRANLNEKVYQFLKTKILAREFSPGERLKIDRLKEDIGISGTPIKDALIRLAGEGLVDILPRKGTFVSKLSAKDYAELFDVRLILELYAAELALKKIKPEELETMSKIVKECKRIVSEPEEKIDYPSYVENDRRFHDLMVKASGNKKLYQLYQSLHVHIQIGRVYYFRTPTRAKDSQREHELILKAFFSQDLRLLKRALREHIINAKEFILKRITSS